MLFNLFQSPSHGACTLLFWPASNRYVAAEELCAYWHHVTSSFGGSQ
jgi:hypothetical protein